MRPSEINLVQLSGWGEVPSHLVRLIRDVSIIFFMITTKSDLVKQYHSIGEFRIGLGLAHSRRSRFGGDA